MRFPKISPIVRIVFGLVGLTTSMILLASFIGLFPDRKADIVRCRKQLCDSVAIGFSAMADRVDASKMQSFFDAVLKRNDDVVSVGLRRADGSIVVDVGEHRENWSLKDYRVSTDNEICIPVFDASQELWGTVEVHFIPIESPGLAGLIQRPEFKLAGFMMFCGTIVFFFYLRVVLQQLRPSKVVPGRVREALDSLAEGLLVLDRSETIVLANRAFLEATGKDLDSLLGQKATSLPFESREEGSDSMSCNQPWRRTIKDAEPIRGSLLGLKRGDEVATFSVSCAPILDEKGKNRGAIASFENVTQLQARTNELKDMVTNLNISTAEIKRQNQELERLATIDPLTGCDNRRSFLMRIDTLWNAAIRYDQPLSAIMIDIDHFKSVNDKFGHAVGDEVLQEVAQTLLTNSRASDVVCRYGGEEFAIILPSTTIDDACHLAGKIKKAISDLKLSQLSVTASLGVSSTSQSPDSTQELLEQADKCLYVAKRNGRNQVVRWDDVPNDIEFENDEIAGTKEVVDEFTLIPFHAVTALISALAYRDQETANHSRRVADLCVAVAEGMLPLKDCYTLEIAGLLHDIGKIGVPDSILLKPERLTEDEWKIMQLNERIGVELINAAFASPVLTDIVSGYRVHYGSTLQNSGTNLPVGARILAIVDAFDSMTTDRAYRKGLSTKEAFAELRQCAGKQFDPELVERLIYTVKARGSELVQSADHVTKTAALNIGAQIERLSCALDRRDIPGIGAIAGRLEETAGKHGAAEIADKASMILAIANHDGELYEIMRCTNELLDLCRASQRSLLVPSAVS